MTDVITDVDPFGAATPAQSAGGVIKDADPFGISPPADGTDKPSRLERVGREIASPFIEAGRVASHIPDPTGFLPDLRGPHPIPPLSATLDDASKHNEAQIAAARGPDPGFNWERLGLDVVNPINYAGGVAGKAAGLGAKLLPAVAGAGAGILQPATGDNFGAKKLGQATEGAALGYIPHAIIGTVKGLAAAASKVAEPIMNWLGQTKGPEAVKDAAAQEILKRITQDTKAGGPTAMDMLDLINKTPSKPLSIADVGGENLLALAGRISRSPGESRQIMTQFLNERDLNAGLRLGQDVDSALAKGEVHTAERALTDARAAAARPAYEAAYEHAPINPDEMLPTGQIGQLLPRPSMRAGMANAMKIAAEEGRDPNTLGIGFNEAGDPVFLKVPSWQTLDYVKRGVDNVVEQYRDKTTGRLVLDTYGRAADMTRTAYRNALKDLNPSYAKAMAAFSGPSTSMDAIRAGEEILLREPSEIAERMKMFDAGDKEFFKLGAASTLRKAIAKTGAHGDEARKIVGNSYTRAQLRPLFDSEAEYSKFIDAVTAESKMFATRGEVLKNSATARRLAEDGSDLDAAGHGSRAAGHVAGGNLLGAIDSARRAAESLGITGDREVNAEIARVLAMPASNIPNSMWDRISVPPGPKAAPPPSRLGQTIPWAAPGTASTAEQLGVFP